jgi:1-phosphofructokinase
MTTKLNEPGRQVSEGDVRAPLGRNQQLASDALQRPLRSEEDLWIAVDQLLEMGTELMALSRGAAGALVGLREGIIRAVPPSAVMVKSPIGAGDALLAGTVFAVRSGLGLEPIAGWATARGTEAAVQEGTGMGERSRR